MNAELRALSESYWQDELKASPIQALMLGIHDYDELMDDASREAEDDRIAELRSFTARAAAFDPEGLSRDDQITREVLMFEGGTNADMLEMREAELAVNHAMGIHALLPVLFPQFPIDEPEYADAMLAKYAALATMFDQLTDRLRTGVAAGRTPMTGTVEKTVAQIDEHLSADPAASVFMNIRSPQAYSDEQTAEWRSRLAAVVAESVYPAYRRYRDYIADHVLPATRSEEAPGICHLPGGEEWYRRAIKRHTSVDLSARQIHEIGLAQIAKLDDEYRQLGSEVLGTSNLQEIYSRLRDDPELKFKTGEEAKKARYDPNSEHVKTFYRVNGY